MRQKQTTRNSKALILTECLIAVTILGMLLTGFWYSLSTFRTFNRIQMARLRCTAAAESQLDSLTATGKVIDDATIEKLWPGVSLHVSRTPGEGKWAGMEHLTVQAETKVQERPVRMDFMRYLTPNSGRKK